MKPNTRVGSRRKGVSGIIAAVMLFAMLFSVGTSYFLFVNNNNQLYSRAAVGNAAAAQSKIGENLEIKTSAPPPNYYISYTVSNLGGESVNITAVYVTNSTGYVLAFYKAKSAGISPALPYSVNTGGISGTFVTSVVYSSGRTYDVRLITQRGNAFVATYPPTATSLAAQALSSGAIGDLYLAFQSYHYYNVYTGSGCPNGAPYSGYCVNNKGVAFSIASSLMTSNYNVAFSVTITDLNQEGSNIVLDPYTLMTLVPESGKGSLSYIPWFVVSNKSTGGFNAIMSTYTPVVLTYDAPVTVLFASGFPLVSSGFTSSDLQAVGNIAQGTTTPVFMVSHGCEAQAITTCSVNQANYGQNSPYVTTLFY